MLRLFGGRMAMSRVRRLLYVFMHFDTSARSAFSRISTEIRDGVATLLAAHWRRGRTGTAVVACLMAGACFSSGQLITPQISAGQQIPAVAIAVTRFGPEPAEIIQKPGPFTIVIEDHSGVTDDTFSFQLKKERGMLPASQGDQPPPALFHLTSTPNRNLDYKLVDLLPGEYVLTFKRHPKWSVAITIVESN